MCACRFANSLRIIFFSFGVVVDVVVVVVAILLVLGSVVAIECHRMP